MNLLRQDRQDAVLTLTLSDEATRNALSERMIGALDEALDAATEDTSIKAIVIAAAGPVFCSGHNLKELTAHRVDADQGGAYFAQIFNSCARVMTKIATHRCAIIAAVDGMASAAGCQLVATCDLAYASPRARFCTPGVNIGLFCSTPMVAVSRALPRKLAMEMLLTGDVVDAEFALRAGLINCIVPQNELGAHVASLAAKIATKSSGAIAHGKRLFDAQLALPLEEAYASSAAVMVQNMLEESAIEGIGAFLEKRPAVWPQ